MITHLKRRGFLLNESERKLRSFRNKYKGQSAVVIGTGPSLRVQDLERLSGFITFGCNKVFLAFQETDWRPDFYTICDSVNAENFGGMISTQDFANSTIIHAALVRKYMPVGNGDIFYEYSRPITDILDKRKVNLNRGVSHLGIFSHGYSVNIDQIQLAYYMGFKKVYLIGVDFNYSLGDLTEEKSESGRVVVSNGEQNHFHKDYHKIKGTYTVPKLDEQRLAYKILLDSFRKEGRHLINASRSSKLDVIPFENFEDIFS